VTKRPHVPETRVTKPNREQRRHPQPRDVPPPQEQAPPNTEQVLREGAQDVTSVRAKNSGHKKKTADKWNQ
jgi:hypothetical protein